MSAPRLIGREPEIRRLDGLLDDLPQTGGSLVLHGDPGIGKSVLLAEAKRRARDRGLRVLSASGVETEAQLAYAALHQVLRPLLGDLDGLAPPQRAALRATFGLVDGERPDLFLIALATLNLLTEAAAARPVLVALEDAHWLDQPSAEVLTFVARRIESDAVVLVAATRDAPERSPDWAGLHELCVGSLDDASAAALLDAQPVALPAAARERVLTEAAGNPLALIELPLGWASRGTANGAEPWLPLTERLERAFAARAGDLPARTRAALLVAAVDEGDALDEILAATARLLGAAAVSIDILEPARVAGLVDVDDRRLAFHHPLVRSALHQSTPVAQRHAAHAALAEVLDNQPERQVWHRAASAVGADEAVASELERAAEQALARGAVATAVATLERAARLTGTTTTQGRLLVRAAQLAHDLGRPGDVVRLVDEAGRLDLTRFERTMVAWLREELDPATWSGATSIRSFAEIAAEINAAGDPERALRCLLSVALRLWWTTADQALRDFVVGVAQRLDVDAAHPAVIAITAYADPVNRGAEVLDRIARHPVDDGLDPAGLYLLGSAATAVWAHDMALPYFEAAVEGLRRQGRLGLLTQALVSEAWAALHLAKGRRAATAADEAARLARETGQPRWAITAQLAQAALAAERGDEATADELLAPAEAALIAAGAHPMLALVQFARGRGAVAHRRYDEGFDHLRRILDPGDIAYHPFVGAWALSDLIEAASHLGRSAQAEDYLARLEALVSATPGSLLEAELAYARPVLAGDDAAEPLYATALDGRLGGWPCYRGRLLLQYGSWLRRQRRVTESRAPLRAARETFDALSFGELAAAARRELRASGESSRRRVPDARDELTPQELQIAELAASGLSNKEIGQRLYLSHRTVGSHLYRLYPKLGITSRAELRDALGAAR